MTDPTPDDTADAVRTAIALARAATAGHAELASELWNGAPDQSAVLWSLARLPGYLAAGVAAHTGHRIDIDLVLKELALNAADPPAA